MANSGMSNLNPTFWAREAQRSLFVENKAMAIANTTLRNLVAGEGDTVNRTIISYPASETYTPGTDLTNRAITGSKEALSIATFLASKVTIDDTEKRQSIVSLGENVARKMMHNLNNDIEQRVLTEVTNALWTVDDGNIGGTAGNNAQVTTNNIPLLFTAADTKLDATDAPKAGRTAVVGTHLLNTLKLQQAGRQTAFGDGVNSRGVVANLFGWDILYSNNLPYSATLNIATAPTDGDTVTIAGVVFTFKTTVSTATAGHVLINTTAANALGNLVKAINDSGTVDTDYVQLSAENRFLLRDKRRVAATNNTTNIALTGYGDIVVSETLTATGDTWTARLQDALFCVKGCIDMIVQMPPVVEVTRDPDQFADIVKSLTGFGKKTYADGAREMVRVKVDAGTSDWA